MKTTRFVLSLLVGLLMLLAACSPQAAATNPPPATEPAAVPVTGAATVNIGKNDTLGSFLVDDKGMTLYLFTKDTANTSNCYVKCATTWPPLLTTGNPVAGEGLDASLLGTTTRTDGTVQVTYHGWPLYYYEKDQAPGDVTGQDVGDVWFVVSPAGEQVSTP
jgi:predicted lipoprotein with Yx(FWY)xxD motif